MVVLISCSKKNEITYKPLSLVEKEIEYISNYIPFVSSMIRRQERIFFCYKDLYEINLKEKTGKLIFPNGVGPDEIFNPCMIRTWDNNIYINSNYQLEYIYKFNPDSEIKKIERVNLGKVMSFDDFEFISKNLIVMSNVYWKDGIVQIYNREKNTFTKIGTPTYVKIMDIFNVNTAFLGVDNGMIYLAEAIKPEIKIISTEQAKIVKFLILSPPFYISMPAKYTPKKYDIKAHRQWMAGWTSISNVIVNNGWLLVRYRWGYNFEFGYELIKLDRPDNRYYIDKTAEEIYDFSIEGKKIIFYMVESTGDGDLTWETAKAFFL